MRRTVSKLWVTSMFAFGTVWTGAFGAVLPLHVAEAQPSFTPPELEGVRVIENFATPLPMDATFRTHEGQVVRLGDLFDGKKPVLLNLVYHSCPMLCNVVLDSTLKSIKGVPWSVGDQYRAVVISIDPAETTERSAAKRASVLDKYGRQSARESGAWVFLTGTEENIRRVADTVGFQYRYHEQQKQYAHPAVTFLIRPDGRVGRYLYGIDLKPVDVRLGLFEASQGRSMSTVDRVILYCYHYDPKAGSYVLMATRVMQLGGLLTLMVLSGFLWVYWRRELRHRAAIKSSSDSPVSTGRANSSASSSSTPTTMPTH
jgi:protein SCO1/2